MHSQSLQEFKRQKERGKGGRHEKGRRKWSGKETGKGATEREREADREGSAKEKV